MGADESLEVLGVTAPQESAYRLLLSHPGCSIPEVSRQLGMSRNSVHAAIGGLERLGLVSKGPGQEPAFFPVAPDVALEALILHRQAELERARAQAKQLMDDFNEGRKSEPPGMVEIVSGAEAVHRRFEQLQRGARHRVQVLDTPPYAGLGGTPNRVEMEALARGVEYLGIYDRAALEAAPGTINAIARYVAAGEQARFLPRLPFKLATIDTDFGYVPLAVSQPDIARFMVIRPCSLLDALFYVFDILWERATPIMLGEDGAVGDGGPSPDARPVDSLLLNLLAAGMTDEAAARHLQLSYRTTRRRVAELMDALGAQSRFQAGVQAAHRGWV